MNREEAIGLLDRELAHLRGAPYSELMRRISTEAVNLECTAPSGAWYQIEIQCVWDDRPGGNIRVIGSIDNGKWRAFLPLTRGFIKAPDGSFVGE